MPTIAKTILHQVLDLADLTRPRGFSRSSGRPSMISRLAAAGILRLALRWPVLSVAVVIAVIVARVMSARRHESDDAAQVRRAP